MIKGIKAKHSWPAGRPCLGLTLVEVLIVIMLFAATAAMTAPFAGRSLSGHQASATAELVTDALRQAQTESMSHKNAGIFGVHFESDNFVYFAGAIYNPADPDNIVHDMYDDIGLSHSFGGADDVIFDNHRGLPSVSGTVTVTADGGQTQVVTIGPAGAIGR